MTKGGGNIRGIPIEGNQGLARSALLPSPSALLPFLPSEESGWAASDPAFAQDHQKSTGAG